MDRWMAKDIETENELRSSLVSGNMTSTLREFRKHEFHFERSKEHDASPVQKMLMFRIKE